MNFEELNKKIANQFNKMVKTGKLFISSVTGAEVWDVWIQGFKSRAIFRDPNTSVMHCNCCNNFLRRYGNIVTIENGKVISMFTDLGDDLGVYSNSIEALKEKLENASIDGVFLEKYDMLNEKLNYEKTTKTQNFYQLGIHSNLKRYTLEEVNKFGHVKLDKTYEFFHFNVQLPREFVYFGSESKETLLGLQRDKYQVFRRAMYELSIDTLELVEDLIYQNSLLDGKTHLHAIKDAIKLKKEFDNIGYNKDLWIWDKVVDLDERTAKFKNTLIGTLCYELNEGKPLNEACLSWNKRVDPKNYHKASAPITKKQIEDAKKYLKENGYEDSFDRVLANLDDIKTSEIQHINVGDGKIKEVSIFDNVKPTKNKKHSNSKLDAVSEITIEKFMNEILPNCSSIEVFVDNQLEGNFVTLTKSKSNESKQITKWGGAGKNYSWTFNGNLAGKSFIKDAVQKAGGKIDGVLNFRLAWNDIDGSDNSDLDAWAIEPNGAPIGYNTNFRSDRGHRSDCSGQLDIDNMNPNGKMGVENITWIDKNKMHSGKYLLYVNQYCSRNSKGFKAEVEFDNKTYSYVYDQPVHGRVNVATIILNKDGFFSIEHHLPESNQSKNIWSIETNEFHKVNLVCKSPNHWGDNSVGNLHYFFMLEGCKAEGKIRSFHNENLLPDILKHRKVLEVLGSSNMLDTENVDKQLSGIGFNSTVSASLLVRCKGNFNRMVKIIF